MAGGEKTEAPTPRRREDVRKKGNVPKSTELTSALALLAGVLILRNVGANMALQMLDLMRNSFREIPALDWTVASVNFHGITLGLFFLGLMAPLFVTMIGVGAASNLLQSGLVLTPRPLSPDMSRIDPWKGFKRIASQRSLVELAKSLAKVGIIGYVVYQVFQDRYYQMMSLSSGDLYSTIGLMTDIAAEIILKAGFALLLLAGLDYGYNRWEYEKNLRMTKEEVREEMRQSEGDPMVRSKIRQQQRQMASRRMMADVPSSDVVVTNPTHLAVALQYKPESMRSPKVLAKGQDLIAQRIKEVAREHGVPVVENKPLAQALFKTVDVGSEIPPALFHAVAEVLAFIYSLRRQRRVGGYVGS